ncbi:LamG-like jellyroll fold domain-containing protein, partial [Desulfolithobacter sp.]
AELEDVDKATDSRLDEVDTELSSRLGDVEMFLEANSTFDQDKPVDVSDTILARVAKIVASSTTIVSLARYDTIKDSDGGAWVKTQSAAKPELLFVADSAGVKCYDLTDPDTQEITALALTLTGVSSITVRNRVLVVGTSAGVKTYDVGDSLRLINTYTTTTTPAIINDTVNDVAITVLAQAQTDQVTGLPIPTIAVATDGGFSIIHDNRTVVHIPMNNVQTGRAVSFRGNSLIAVPWYSANNDSRVYVYNDVSKLTSDTAAGQWPTEYDAYYYRSGIPQFGITINPGEQGQATVLAGHMIAHGNLVGLTFLYDNPSASASGMIAKITTDWTSGWLPGDIRGAWLADTTAETITGSGELITNGTFDADTTGWASSDSGILTIDTGRLKIENGDTAFGRAYQEITTVAGKTYTVWLDYTVGTATAGMDLQARDATVAGTLLGGSGVITSSGRVSITFVASSTVTVIRVGNASSVLGEYGFFDNITCKLAERDRSIKNTGLHVVGSLTKSAVATGAELVAYSGFSDLDYFEQPYNPDLDFGTGDFCVMGWVKIKAFNPVNTIFNRDGAGRIFIGIYDTQNLRLYTENGGVITDALTDAIFSADVWVFISCLRKDGTLRIYVNGKEVNVTGQDNGVIDVSGTAKATWFIDASANEFNGSGCLFRIAAYAPSADQIKHIYETEKRLFRESAACTLGGTSNAAQVLSYDEDTGHLFAGTADGTSVFSGLCRVDYIDSTGTPTSDDIKAIAAGNGSYAIATSAEVVAYVPAQSLREELPRAAEQQAAFGAALVPFWFVADGTTAEFPLPPGWKPVITFSGGALVKEGVADQYTVQFDGFRYAPVFAVIPASGTDVCIMARRV